jgi:hypothetical protein
MNKLNRFFLGQVAGNVLFGLLCIVMAAFIVQACAAFKTAVKTADDIAAQLLCAQSKAELTGISVEEARDAYCSTRDTWRPWLDAVLKARRTGAALAAGTKPPADGLGCPPGELQDPYAPTAPPTPKDAPAGGSGAR